MFSLLAVGFSACSNETSVLPDDAGDKPVHIAIALSPEGQNVFTKAVGTTASLITPDDKINTLDIYILDVEGNIEAHVDETAFSFTGEACNQGVTEGELELLPGKKTVYAFANCEGGTFSSLNLATDWTIVPAAVTGNASFNVLPGISADNGFPMSARTTWEVNESVTTYRIEMVRLAAQMSIEIRDERVEKVNVQSLTISGLLPGETHLFRKKKGEVALPERVVLADWLITNESSIAPFYLHETDGEFEVRMQIDKEDNPRVATLVQEIPRNYQFPLIIHVTDYSLDISGQYELAAIGTVVVKKDIGNGYRIELPEGASNISIRICLKSSGTALKNGVTWSCLPETMEHFSMKEGDADCTFVISSKALPAVATGEHPVKLSATFKEGMNDKTVDFDLILDVKALKDGDLKTTKTIPFSLSGQTEPIIIEL